MQDLEEVKVFVNRFEADCAKNLLEQEGIEAMVSADDCGGLRPHLSLATGGVRLLVKCQDVDRAKDILQAFGR
ncbi:MAG: DUF2007 domain-containing protein [Candidatus Omnitrophota bacterium]